MQVTVRRVGQRKEGRIDVDLPEKVTRKKFMQEINQYIKTKGLSLVSASMGNAEENLIKIAGKGMKALTDDDIRNVAYSLAPGAVAGVALPSARSQAAGVALPDDPDDPDNEDAPAGAKATLPPETPPEGSVRAAGAKATLPPETPPGRGARAGITAAEQEPELSDTPTDENDDEIVLHGQDPLTAGLDESQEIRQVPRPKVGEPEAPTRAVGKEAQEEQEEENTYSPWDERFPAVDSAAPTPIDRIKQRLQSAPQKAMQGLQSVTQTVVSAAKQVLARLSSQLPKAKPESTPASVTPPGTRSQAVGVALPDDPDDPDNEDEPAGSPRIDRIKPSIVSTAKEPADGDTMGASVEAVADTNKPDVAKTQWEQFMLEYLKQCGTERDINDIQNNVGKDSKGNWSLESTLSNLLAKGKLSSAEYEQTKLVGEGDVTMQPNGSSIRADKGGPKYECDSGLRCHEN